MTSIQLILKAHIGLQFEGPSRQARAAGSTLLVQEGFKMGKPERDNLARFIAVAGLLLGIIGALFDYQGSRERNLERQVRLTELLYDVRQLTLGTPGSEWVNLEPFDLPREGETAEQLRKQTELALHIAPNNIDALCYRGVYFQRTNQLDKAIVLYKKALSYHKDSPQAHRFLSMTYRRQGKLAEAHKHALKATQLAPNDPGAHSSLGMILSSQGKREQAISHYEMALKADPTFFPAHNNIGFILLHQDDAAGAIDRFRRAVHCNPRSAMSHTNWGLALEVQGNLPEAIEHYKKAIELDPGYTNGYIALAAALLDQGAIEEALEQYRIAKQISPSSRNEKLEAAQTRSTRPADPQLASPSSQKSGK